MPFLLADIYHALHTRHEKKGGTLLCCAYLLYVWFMQHMPEEAHFVSKEFKYPQIQASLTAIAIKWYGRDWETPDIIVSCGEFPNAPLFRTKWCINYNTLLSLRHHGYPMNDPLEVKAL